MGQDSPSIQPWVRRLRDLARVALTQARRSRFWSSRLARLKADTVLPPCGLGLDGLPQGLGQLPTASPVALMWLDTETGLHWLQSLLQDSLANGPTMFLAESADEVRRVLTAPALAQAHQQGRLLTGLLDSHQMVQDQGAAFFNLLQELQHIGLRQEHALFIGARTWVESWTSQTQLQVRARGVRQWCAARRRPVVFLFDGTERADDWQAQLSGMPGLFPHLAILGTQTHRPLLLLERWDGADGPVFRTGFGLQVDAESQRLRYDGSQRHGWQGALIEAPDQFMVMATQAAVARQSGVPKDWTLIDGYDQVLDATRHAIGATVLLHAGTVSDFDALSRLVHTLRLQHPRSLKIVVREGLQKLRANDEQALLSLGANAVVYKEVGFTRLQQFLLDLNTRVYARVIEADYDKTVSEFMAVKLRDYLAPLAFCDAVETMLQRSKSVGLTHSLLRLPLLRRVAHLDAIQACRSLRDGDVLSADQDALYVFFFACGEADVEQAIQRLCVLPLDSLFSSMVSDSASDSMQKTLRKLRQAAWNGLPDYSHYVRRPALETTGAPAQGESPARSAATLPGTIPAASNDEGPAPAARPPAVVARAIGRRAREV